MSLPSEPPDPPSAEETVEVRTPETADVYIGPFRVIKKLGAGGMGEVYLARDERLDRKVALKMLPAHFTQDEDQVNRFVREAKAASALNHPNIITIYEIGQSDGKHYMATEYIQGETLRELIAARLPIAKVLDVGIQVASALNAAHEAGIVHRDIKPENVMVRPDGVVKVLDFGIAKLVERSSSPAPPADSTDREMKANTLDEYATRDDPSLTKQEATIEGTEPGLILGTVSYMSPEQLRGQKVDARADIFSLGIVLYQVIAGKSPFAGSSQADVISAILTREPAPLVDSRPETPPHLEHIIGKALQKERESRYQSAQDILTDLTDLKQELDFQAKLGQSRQTNSADGEIGSTKEAIGTGQATSAETAAVVSSEFRQRKRGALSILAILIIAVAGIAYLVYARYSASAGPGIRSIAVLPFRNLSNDPEKEYLSDGISESLINRLSRLPGLKVIANNSSSRYKDATTEPREVARALDANAVVTGRLQQLGDRLSISVELVDGRDSTQLWGERYSRKATDLPTLEAEISSEIAEQLRLRLTTGQQRKFASPNKVNPEAYELLLKGRFHRSRGSMDDRKKAADYFNQAIAVDPGFALPYAELSDIYRSLVGGGVLNPTQYLLEAEQAARKALELDEGLADAHYALANLKTYSWQWDEAEREYKRALELNSNLALAHRWYASYLRLLGRHEQAIAEIQLARDLDPLSPGVNATVAYILFSARQYDEAIEVLKKTLDLDRDYPYTHLFFGFTYAAKGMYPEAIAAYGQAIKLGLDTPSTQIFLGAACAQAGDRTRAEAILKQVQASKAYVSPAELATLYTALGDHEQAFALIEKAYAAHDFQLQYLGVSPSYDPLRSDPRFQDLLRRIGLTG